MAVLMRVQVRNQLHEVVRVYEEPDGEPFLRFCRRAAIQGVRYVDFTWPYQDSMLNEYQLKAWLEDLPNALNIDGLPEDERSSVVAILQAAREAEDLAGYLFIEG
ncbi:hypothetical protein [Nocardioides taihuensis]|uniref:Uncharacterized protein n=1 Tax=Nocardioides taihuensis TaxID=1835606 RepID=A0ABW0BF85_9ACTN